MKKIINKNLLNRSMGSSRVLRASIANLVFTSFGLTSPFIHIKDEPVKIKIEDLNIKKAKYQFLSLIKHKFFKNIQ